jgi:hypothetical protein
MLWACVLRSVVVVVTKIPWLARNERLSAARTHALARIHNALPSLPQFSVTIAVPMRFRGTLRRHLATSRHIGERNRYWAGVTGWVLKNWASSVLLEPALDLGGAEADGAAGELEPGQLVPFELVENGGRRVAEVLAELASGQETLAQGFPSGWQAKCSAHGPLPSRPRR